MWSNCDHTQFLYHTAIQKLTGPNYLSSTSSSSLLLQRWPPSLAEPASASTAANAISRPASSPSDGGVVLAAAAAARRRRLAFLLLARRVRNTCPALVRIGHTIHEKEMCVKLCCTISPRMTSSHTALLPTSGPAAGQLRAGASHGHPRLPRRGGRPRDRPGVEQACAHHECALRRRFNADRRALSGL